MAKKVTISIMEWHTDAAKRKYRPDASHFVREYISDSIYNDYIHLQLTRLHYTAAEFIYSGLKLKPIDKLTNAEVFMSNVQAISALTNFIESIREENDKGYTYIRDSVNITITNAENHLIKAIESIIENGGVDILLSNNPEIRRLAQKVKNQKVV